MIQPPKWALNLLKFYCKPSKREAIEGDLYELFDLRFVESPHKAKAYFIWNVIRFFRWRNIKGLEDINSLNSIAMFRNYFKVSVRSLLRHKFYSVINILGLSIGIACCLFILMFVNHELSYDKFWKDSENIYRVTLNETGTNTPALLVKQMLEDYPEIVQGCRLQGPFEASFSINGETIRQDGGFYADSTVLDIFDINILYGDDKDVLNEPNSIIITKSLSAKYFPKINAIGKIIDLDGQPMKVIKIVEDAAKNSHFQFTFLAAMPREDWITKGNWTGNNFSSYLKLNPHTNIENLEARFPDFVRKYVGPEILKFTGHSTFDEFLAEGIRFGYNLVPLQKIHLEYPNLSMGKPGKMSNVYLFLVVAFFILLVACINFMNLSTARSATRSKEVGVRKVLGSSKEQLFGQFMIESILISTVAVVVAVLLVVILLPQFNQIAGKEFGIKDIFIIENLLWLSSIGIVTGLLAGSYPAFYLSKIKPVLALKGVLKSKKSSEFVRKGLVSFQFGISILLIISTLIVYTQINYMTNKDLGLNSEQTFIIKNAKKLGNKSDAFLNYLASIPEIESTSLTSHYPSGGFSDWSYSTIEDIPLRLNPYNVFVDAHFIDALDVPLVDGRFFNPKLSSDSLSVVVNEAFVKASNWDNAIGKQVTRGQGLNFTIIGVVKDFHSHSMRSKIHLMLMRYDPNNSYYGSKYILVKAKGNYQQLLSKIESNWQEKVPNEPFKYLFIDDSFNSLYESERKFGELFSLFSVLAIFIGSLGMFALAAFMIERRIKEIAIRKVMGASIVQITSLLIKDFSKLVGLGAVIALPLAYLFSENWLSDFQYQSSIGIHIYLIPVLLVIIISWLTVGYQSYTTAKSNPAEVLQSE